MALLASPDVGVRGRALLRTVRFAFDWPELCEFARGKLAPFKAPHTAILVNGYRKLRPVKFRVTFCERTGRRSLRSESIFLY
jgi:hypothetical protein